MLSVALAFVSSMLWGASDFAGGVSSRRSSALHATLWSFVGATVVSGVAVLLREGDATGRAYAAGVAAGVLGLAGFLTLYAALATAHMGVVTVIVGASEAIVPVVIGVAWQHDSLSALAWLGVAAAIGGAAMIGLAEGDKGRASARALALATASGVFFGFSVVALDAAPEGSGFVTPAVEVGVGFVLMLVLAWAIRRVSLLRRFGTATGIWSPSAVASRPVITIALIGGLFLALANITLLLALWEGQLAVVGVVLCLYPVATAVLARLILHERLTRLQIVGIGVALAGCALLAAA